MARGQQLSQLLQQLQAEVGLSLAPNTGLSTTDHRIQLLNRWQARLYAAFDWDFAFVKRDVAVAVRDRLLQFPADLELERIDVSSIATGTANNDWRELGYGIGEAQYRLTDENAIGCPQRWAPAEGGKFEIWPSADGPYRVRFRGAAQLQKMVNSSDRAVLDDTLIVLHAASEVLKRQKAPDWEDKLREAQMHFTRLRSMLGGNKRRSFVSGGGVSGLIGDRPRPLVPGLDYIAS